MYCCTAPTRLLSACALLLFAHRAQGQGALVVRPVQNLTFGTLLPGVPTTIDALDLARSAQIEVKSARGETFEIRFTLPAALLGAGSTLPLAFGSSSAGVSASSSPSAMVRFDPKLPARFTFPSTNKITFFLGGQALPTRAQPIGAYNAPVIITITNLGV
ncbi:MAG TPA: hypothetical protein VE861_15880 [Gemmatimonadaceae bacterium]|nr:hypothetical protein [Gemmatimonadaceae bacterium]